MCANTQSAAIGSAKASFAIRHTGGARASIQEARDALKLSWRYVQAFEAEAAKLYAAPMEGEAYCERSGRRLRGRARLCGRHCVNSHTSNPATCLRSRYPPSCAASNQ